MGKFQPVGEQLKAIVEGKNLSTRDAAELAGLDVNVVRALLDGAGEWASAVHLLNSLRKVGFTKRLHINAYRDRRLTIRSIAGHSGLSTNTVMECIAHAEKPLDTARIRLESLQRFCDALGDKAGMFLA